MYRAPGGNRRPVSVVGVPKRTLTGRPTFATMWPWFQRSGGCRADEEHPARPKRGRGTWAKWKKAPRPCRTWPARGDPDLTAGSGWKAEAESPMRCDDCTVHLDEDPVLA